MTQNINYGYDVQKLYLEMMLSDAETFVRCQSIFDFLAPFFQLKNGVLCVIRVWISSYPFVSSVVSEKLFTQAQISRIKKREYGDTLNSCKPIKYKWL